MLGHLKAGATTTVLQQQIDALNASNDVRFPQFTQLLRTRFHTVSVLLQDDVVRM
jgi:hypothetical protein